MAARTMKTRKSKRSPTQKSTFLSASFPAGDTTDVQVDIPKCLSIMNNRLYRQGKLYKAKLTMTPQVAVQNAGVKLEVFALNNNWLNQQAWQLAKDTYDRKYLDEEDIISDKQRARWRDFRVDSGSFAIEMLPNTLDQPNNTGNRTTFAVGEFPPSAVVDAAGLQKQFTWGATQAGAYGVVDEMRAGGYNKETSMPQNTTGAEPYAGLTADSSDAEGSLYQTLGAEAPYGVGVDAFAPFVQVASLGFSQDVASGTAKLSTGMFDAPCGIVLVRFVNSAQDLTLDLKLEVADGKYNGVHALDM